MVVKMCLLDMSTPRNPIAQPDRPDVVDRPRGKIRRARFFDPARRGGLRDNTMALLRVSDFDYDLPSELIAQVPAPERTGSRLLHVDGAHLADLSSPICRD
jgi:hypothetical protein